MNLAVSDSLALPAQPVFTDGLGERHQIVNPRGDRLEVLRLSSAIRTLPNLERLLVERIDQVWTLRHEAFMRVRSIDVDDSTGARVVVSEYVSGVRLSSLLASAEKRAISVDLNVVRCLLRQLVRAMAAWRETLKNSSHSAIGPERIVMTPQGRLVVADPVLGSVIEQLRYSRDRYWSELRVALPLAPAAPTFDARSDLTQVALVALALVLGRRLSSDVYPSGLSQALATATLRSGSGGASPLAPKFREWLRRALQLDSRESFPSAIEANASLDDAIGPEETVLERDAVHVFVARCLALDVRQSKDPSSGSATDDRLSLEEIGDDVTPEVDLGPRIEALRAFLARYPLHPKAAEAPAMPPAPPLEPPTAPPLEEVAKAPAPPDPPAPPVETPIEPYEPIDPIDPIEPLEPPAWGAVDETPFDASTAATVDPDAPARRSAAPVPDDWTRRLRIGAALVLIIGAGIVGAVSLGLLRAPRVETGTYKIATAPPGATVVIDNVRRGITPLEIDLAAGQHAVEIITPSGRRQLPITIKAGGEMSQFIEQTGTAPSSTANGELQIRTEPPAASVTVDGRPVGRSPVSVGDLAPGTHTVVLTNASGTTITQRVLIEPGRIASLLVPMADRPPTGAAAGWIAVTAPEDVQVFEGDRFLGSNRIDRIMLPIGRHDLDIVNESLAYRERRTVNVSAGQVSTLRLDWPNGTLAINAVPWAEAFVDGMPVGETPIGAVKVPLGVHEVVFRHPELGERRAKVTVTAGTPAKVGVDLRTK